MQQWQLELAENWCEHHCFPWKIVNNHFYWQTHIQTGEITPEKKIIWHNHDYFDTIHS